MQEYIDLALNYSIKILGAILIFIVGKWTAALITKIFKNTLIKANTDITLIKFLGDLIYFTIIALFTLAALGTLGVNTTSFAALIGALGLAIGLALQGNIANFGAGVVLLFLRPFKIGDFVETAGVSGSVEEIGIFNTTIKTGDNKIIIIPNSNIIGNNIINYSKEPTRRVDLVIGVSYEDDLKLVKKTLEEILKNHPKVLKEPTFNISLAELGDSSINFNVRAWVKTEDYWDVRSELLEKIKITFDEKGINIPYPTIDVNLKKAS